MGTANEDFIKKFMRSLEKNGEPPEKDDATLFFRILDAKTVGELYAMDIAVEDVERLIRKSEVLLRGAEGNFWFCSFLADNIHRYREQKKKKMIF